MIPEPKRKRPPLFNSVFTTQIRDWCKFRILTKPFEQTRTYEGKVDSNGNLRQFLTRLTYVYPNIPINNSSGNYMIFYISRGVWDSMLKQGFEPDEPTKHIWTVRSVTAGSLNRFLKIEIKIDEENVP